MKAFAQIAVPSSLQSRMAKDSTVVPYRNLDSDSKQPASSGNSLIAKANTRIPNSTPTQQSPRLLHPTIRTTSATSRTTAKRQPPQKADARRRHAMLILFSADPAGVSGHDMNVITVKLSDDLNARLNKVSLRRGLSRTAGNRRRRSHRLEVGAPAAQTRSVNRLSCISKRIKRQSPPPMHQFLPSVLFPECRRRVLGLLLLRPDESLHGREVARRARLPAGTITREPTGRPWRQSISRKPCAGQTQAFPDRERP